METKKQLLDRFERAFLISEKIKIAVEFQEWMKKEGIGSIRDVDLDTYIDCMQESLLYVMEN